jgi:hypothetical protein
LTRHPGRIPILILVLIIAALILVGGPLGGVVIPRAGALAQSNPAGLWTLFYETQHESDESGLPYWNFHYYSQVATHSYLNVTEEGKVDTFRTSEGEFLKESSGFDITGTPPTEYVCSAETRDSFAFDVTGSVTGQVGSLSASSLSITQTETQSSGNIQCLSFSGEGAAKFMQSFPGDKQLPWVDGYVFSIMKETQASQGEGLFGQDIRSITVGLQQLQSYCKMSPVCVGSGKDDQGPISPPASIPSPNTATLSDGSTIHLGGSTLSWNSPGNFTLSCQQTCASDSFDFLRGSWGTILNVNCPSGSCATITAIRGANFSLSAAGNHVTVNDFDGIIRVGARNSSSAVFLSGALGAYSQKVTLNTNENLTTLQKNATTTYATVPRTCKSGTVLFNSGRPISGDLSSIQFCVPAGQVTRLQFSVPPSLQNLTSLYTATSNSSAIAVLASGENTTGTTASGIMALSGIPTEMPIPLISPSGNDPVTITVNNTGSATALVMFQLQFPSLSVALSTTPTTSSPTTSATASSTGGGGIPEFPLQTIAVVAIVAIVAGSYLLVRQRRRVKLK